MASEKVKLCKLMEKRRRDWGGGTRTTAAVLLYCELPFTFVPRDEQTALQFPNGNRGLQGSLQTVYGLALAFSHHRNFHM